jgi:hypothetical protein
MNRFLKITSYLLLIFNILLVFLLIFESKVSLPLAMNPLGRMHPLLLHIPIGFSVFLVLVFLFRKEFDSVTFQKISQLLLTLTGLSLSIVALMGFFLSQEGGFDENILNFHKWSGAAVSVFCYGLILFYDKIKFYANSSGSWTLLAIMALAGHFGASITHGENYLFEPFQSKETKVVFTENSSLYAASVYPILEAKCISCHNDKKIKGELNMTTIDKIVKGGKNGAIWKAGDALQSHVIQRANLPIDDKKHMPPRGKTQLTTEEIVILTSWINEGADLKKAIKDYETNSKSKALAMSTIKSNSEIKSEKIYSFSAASESDILDVNTAYCTVIPLANESPALQADFYVSKKFELKNLENLSKVKDQLVILNLAKMPIKDEDISIISKFPNLEKLTLNQTEITGKTLDQLKNCKNLSSISLSGTKISKTDLEKLASMPSLKEIFVWDTPIDLASLNDLSKKYPKINFEKGAIIDEKEILKLNPPILVNEEFVIKGNTAITLKHNLRNVKIHYTVDGTEPDSTTKTIYTKPLVANGATKLKAIATKEGWYASRKINYYFFKSTYTPDSVYLLNLPDPKYAKQGYKALIDLKKGVVDNTDMAWLGYRETSFSAIFEFKEAKSLKDVTVSFLKKIDSYIMPPATIEIWAGDTKNDLKLLQKNAPIQPLKSESSEVIGISLPMNGTKYKFVKVVANPVKKLPVWHSGKGQKGWVFIDEILFN